MFKTQNLVDEEVRLKVAAAHNAFVLHLLFIVAVSRVEAGDVRGRLVLPVTLVSVIRGLLHEGKVCLSIEVEPQTNDSEELPEWSLLLELTSHEPLMNNKTEKKCILVGYSCVN